MRQVVHGMFTPQAVERWRPLARSVIHALLDEVEAQGSLEILHEFAMPMTVSVIAQLLGFPHQKRDVLRALSEALLTMSRWRCAPGERDRIAEVVHALLASLTPLVDARRTQLTNDLLSVLVRGEQHGTLTRHEVLANTLLLLAAGHETTLSLIGSGLLAWLHHTAQWARFTPGRWDSMQCLRSRRCRSPGRREAAGACPWRGAVDDHAPGYRTQALSRRAGARGSCLM
jgi:cytochrome P450